jgi:hypothetical protein
MIYTAQYSFTRPANTTQYSANDLVANNATAASVVPMSFGINRLGRAGIIRGVRLYKSDKTATSASFKVHLFTADPGTPTNGDNGAFGVASAENYLDAVSVDLSSSGLAGGTTGIMKRSAATAIPFEAPALNNKLYGLLEAIGTYTPASGETFTVTLEIEVS